MDSSGYLPPLRFRVLTAWYDAVVAVTTRSAVWTARMAQHASPDAGHLVLDLGCGTGTLLASLAQRHGSLLFGLDADERALGVARSKLAGAQVSLARGRAERLPFEDGRFDMVLSSLFFHHLRSDAKLQALREAWRVLRPGGRVLIADWGKADGAWSAATFVLVRLLDGFDTTRDSVVGAMPALIAKCGFEYPTEQPALSTPLGVVRFWEARRA